MSDEAMALDASIAAEKKETKEAALVAIRPLATFVHGLVELAEWNAPKDSMPAEIECQLADITEMARKAIVANLVTGNPDYDTGILLTLSLLALAGLKDPEAVKGVHGGPAAAFVDIAYALHDHYRRLVREADERRAEMAAA